MHGSAYRCVLFTNKVGTREASKVKEAKRASPSTKMIQDKKPVVSRHREYDHRAATPYLRHTRNAYTGTQPLQ